MSKHARQCGLKGAPQAGDNDQNVSTPVSGTVRENQAQGIDGLQLDGFNGPENDLEAPISEEKDGVGTEEGWKVSQISLMYCRAFIRMI